MRHDDDINDLRATLRACDVCARAETPLQHVPRPIFQINRDARILIASQAPGIRAHDSGTPFMDPSGVRLRNWLRVTEDQFYDPRNFAIVPMGFCFPGWDKNGGDLPPRKECAPLWRERVLSQLPNLKLSLLIGAHAQRWHLGGRAERTLTETVRKWRTYEPDILPLPHPSWRNNAWIAKNPLFESELLPFLRTRISDLLGQSQTGD